MSPGPCLSHGDIQGPPGPGLETHRVPWTGSGDTQGPPCPGLETYRVPKAWTWSPCVTPGPCPSHGDMHGLPGSDMEKHRDSQVSALRHAGTLWPMP